jgi:phage gp46-like protein
MDYLLINDSYGNLMMSFDASNDIRNNILLSLHIKKGSFFLDPNFGSRDHEIKSTTQSDINLAIAYGKEALQWMQTANKVSKIEISAYSIKDKIYREITVTLPNGKIENYTTFFRVE